MSCSSPIKRYNYERSAYRCVEGRYERTAFFESLIARGLQFATRLSAEHLLPEEKAALGIAEDAATGTVYLSHYGLAPPMEHYSRDCAGGDCVPGCCSGARKRCRAHTDAQRSLWHAVSAAVGAQLPTKGGGERDITVTKSTTDAGCRSVTRVVIEISCDGGDVDDASLSAAAAAAAAGIDATAAASASATDAASVPQLMRQDAAGRFPCRDASGAVISRSSAPPPPPVQHHPVSASDTEDTLSFSSADESFTFELEEPAGTMPAHKRRRTSPWGSGTWSSGSPASVMTTFFEEPRWQGAAAAPCAAAAAATAPAAQHNADFISNLGAAPAALMRDDEPGDGGAALCPYDAVTDALWSEARLLDDVDVDVLSSLF
ncbi:hypothetical protein JKP88DRAFT_281616 [Tribonema minus]|uniref:Uncharacterized protein n=1 Tax=Tribonema minus TaxID=303371 RepID=A0A835YN03_9STRA|nr:hypothetical protein JKP88DRAFT_281616 [Tribonema minus]